MYLQIILIICNSKLISYTVFSLFCNLFIMSSCDHKMNKLFSVESFGPDVTVKLKCYSLVLLFLS